MFLAVFKMRLPGGGVYRAKNIRISKNTSVANKTTKEEGDRVYSLLLYWGNKNIRPFEEEFSVLDELDSEVK